MLRVAQREQQLLAPLELAGQPVLDLLDGRLAALDLLTGGARGRLDPLGRIADRLLLALVGAPELRVLVLERGVCRPRGLQAPLGLVHGGPERVDLGPGVAQLEAEGPDVAFAFLELGGESRSSVPSRSRSAEARRSWAALVKSSSLLVRSWRSSSSALSASLRRAFASES